MEMKYKARELEMQRLLLESKKAQLPKEDSSKYEQIIQSKNVQIGVFRDELIGILDELRNMQPTLT